MDLPPLPLRSPHQQQNQARPQCGWQEKAAFIIIKVGDMQGGG
jgi:hypothetical protein